MLPFTSLYSAATGRLSVGQVSLRSYSDSFRHRSSPFSWVFSMRRIDHNNKARLVFWRWTHPLPGSRAFTKYMDEDDRVDADALRQYEDPLPTDPRQQNRLWYRWYREVEEDPRIRQVHRQYLFSRDYAGLAILLACSLSPLSVWQLGSATIAGLYSAALMGQYFLARRAAYNHGVRFVTSVLATKAVAPRSAGGG